MPILPFSIVLIIAYIYILYRASYSIPSILSANTGHLDLIYSLNSSRGCYPIWHQTPVSDELDILVGWGETLVEDILQTLEQVYQNPHEAKIRGEYGAAVMRSKWTWRSRLKEFFGMLENYL